MDLSLCYSGPRLNNYVIIIMNFIIFLTAHNAFCQSTARFICMTAYMPTKTYPLLVIITCIIFYVIED